LSTPNLNLSHPLKTCFVFQSLHNKRVLSIDLSAIMAGSGIRGQFEEKFKALIRDIEDQVDYNLIFPPTYQS
jgi:ATP-dependent Clp protease ATP-binding subunit ClpA